MPQISNERITIRTALATQANVIWALMLRDIRTRFFGHGLGFLLMIAWPLSHIAVFLAIYTMLGRVAPYGDSLIVFLSTGVVPFLMMSYMARFIMYSLVMNAPLLQFPIVKVTSILFARGLLEIFSAVLYTSTFIIVLWFFDIELWPRDTLQALYAMGASALLGFGIGIINGVIASAVRPWITIFMLAHMVIYATSGILFVPDRLPELLRDILSWNPILQCIEWMRSAYYDDYGSIILDKRYALGCALWFTFCGLMLERLVRGRLLHS